MSKGLLHQNKGYGNVACVTVNHPERFIIIIIIITIIITDYYNTCMQSIHNYIPRTNHVCRVYIAAAIL
jgi:hypothetical protein